MAFAAMQMALVKNVGAALKAGGDAAPVLEPFEHALDQIALLAWPVAAGGLAFLARASENAARDFQIRRGLAESTHGTPCGLFGKSGCAREN
jgi:hypothetical protein